LDSHCEPLFYGQEKTPTGYPIKVTFGDGVFIFRSLIGEANSTMTVACEAGRSLASFIHKKSPVTLVTGLCV